MGLEKYECPICKEKVTIEIIPIQHPPTFTNSPGFYTLSLNFNCKDRHEFSMIDSTKNKILEDINDMLNKRVKILEDRLKKD